MLLNKSFTTLPNEQSSVNDETFEELEEPLSSLLFIMYSGSLWSLSPHRKLNELSFVEEKSMIQIDSDENHSFLNDTVIDGDSLFSDDDDKEPQNTTAFLDRNQADRFITVRKTMFG